MEELKNENVTEQPVAEEPVTEEVVVEEPVVEQRPSTKYGRTAYQQQLQEEQAAQGQSEATQSQPQQTGYQYWEGAHNPYQQSGNPQGERPYQQYQNQYNQQQYQQYTTYQEPQAEVRPLYASISMVLVLLSTIITFITDIGLMPAYQEAGSIEELMNLTIEIAQTSRMLMLSSISDVLFWLTVGFLVLDIIQLHKAGKKIGGAIAFAILLRPAYFIWRAHLLGQKKLKPILYTVAVYAISVIEIVVLMSASMEMVMRTMY